MILPFTFGFLFHFLAVYFSYGKSVPSSLLYYGSGALIGAGSITAWYYIAKHTADSSKLLSYGLLWDAMIVLVWLLGPILFYEAKLTAPQWGGVAAILLGMGLLKL